MAVSIDPTNPSHAYFGSWEEGLIEVENDEVVAIFNEGNSTCLLYTSPSPRDS